MASDYLKLYEDYLREEKHASENTLSSYLRDLRQFSEHLAAQRVTDLRKVKTAAIGSAAGYVAWEKLTTDKSVARIVGDTVIGESATDALAGTTEDIRELKGKAGEAADAVSGAAASMGSATVVNGAGEPMPEKYQSYMSTIMRATAEHHGRKTVGDSTVWRRDPAIAASMVNPEVSVSLTASQAVDCGYADGIAPNLEAVLADLDMAGAEVSYYESTLTDDIMGFLANAAVRAILVMLILGGIYMEMHTPGLGFAAAVAAVATVLYFLPMFVGGNMPAWVLLCFIAGVVLIALEIFVVPGFGITGTAGIIAIVAALVGGMLSNDAVTGFDFASLCRSLVIVGIGCLLAVGAVVYLTSSHGPKLLRKHTELMTELTVADGFVGVDMSPARYVGQMATTVTDMRPAGKIEIGSTVFDAVSTGPFIAAHKQVKVTKYENAQLYVSES